MPFPDDIPLWINICITSAVIAFLALNYIRSFKAKPRFSPNEIVFQEWFASGASQKNIFTKFGGAHNCLRLVVTKDWLWVTSWFPFSVIAPIYDLEHVIPFSAIKDIRRQRSFGRAVFVILFTTRRGVTRAIKISPKDPEAFSRSLGTISAAV